MYTDVSLGDYCMCSISDNNWKWVVYCAVEIAFKKKKESKELNYYCAVSKSNVTDFWFKGTHKMLLENKQVNSVRQKMMTFRSLVRGHIKLDWRSYKYPVFSNPHHRRNTANYEARNKYLDYI